MAATMMMMMPPPGLEMMGGPSSAVPGLGDLSSLNVEEVDNTIPLLKMPQSCRLCLDKLESMSSEVSTTDSQEPSTMSGAASPWSLRSVSSTPRGHGPEQTIIILDWDDTLCPTTVCGQSGGFEGGVHSSTNGQISGAPEQLRAVLAELEEEATALFQRASELADKVVVVTNAGEGWVEWSCREWLPRLLPALKNVEIVSARSAWEPLGFTSPTVWKEKTFRDVIEHFYCGSYPNHYKNIICIGDAPYEHEALGRVVEGMRFAEYGAPTRLRSKSIKFLQQPSAERLVSEIQMLREGLEEIVDHDEDLYMSYFGDSL